MATLQTHAEAQQEQVRVAEMVIQQLRAARSNPTNPPPPIRAGSQKQVTECGAFKALTTTTTTQQQRQQQPQQQPQHNHNHTTTTTQPQHNTTTHNTHHTTDRCAFPFLVWAETSGQPAAARGAAWRRRQRRLRSMLRHERQTVAMELAAALHHSWGGGLGMNVGQWAHKTASAGPAEYFDLFSDDGRPEQLVEVPTECGYALAVLASKVFSRREIRRFLSGLGSTASGSGQVVDIPVTQGRRGGGGGLQGSLARQNSTAAVVEHNVDFPARRGLQGFLPGQGSTASSLVRVHGAADEGIQGGFRTFPCGKKSAEVLRQSSARVLASASSSELSSHQMAPVWEPDELGADAARRLRRPESGGGEG